MQQSTPSTSASSSKVFNSSSASAAAETHTRQCVTSDQQSHGAEAYSREFVEFKDRLDRRMVHMQVNVVMHPLLMFASSLSLSHTASKTRDGDAT